MTDIEIFKSQLKEEFETEHMIRIPSVILAGTVPVKRFNAYIEALAPYMEKVAYCDYVLLVLLIGPHVNAFNASQGNEHESIKED